MNFQDLRLIVGQIKKSIQCPKCKANYIDQDIEVVGSVGEDQTFFHATCGKCESEAVINVSVQFDSHMEMTLPNISAISTNEVLDMHNFLKGFDGNFKHLFKAKSST